MSTFEPICPSRRRYIVRHKSFVPIIGGGETHFKPFRSSVILTYVDNFVSFVIDGKSALLEEDSEQWESVYIYNKLDKACSKSIIDWELFAGTLATRLKTGYKVGEEYRFILSVLANAAFLKKRPRCKGCGEKIFPQRNTVVFACPFCIRPLHE